MRLSRERLRDLQNEDEKKKSISILISNLKVIKMMNIKIQIKIFEKFESQKYSFDVVE